MSLLHHSGAHRGMGSSNCLVSSRVIIGRCQSVVAKRTAKMAVSAASSVSQEQEVTINSTTSKSNLETANRCQDFGFTLPDVDKTVMAIILGGGAGSRLYPLTKKRAKPAVPLGANYRLIDIPVSNCINSNINKIYCLTQYNSASLNRHLSNAYNSSVGSFNSRGFVEVLAANQTRQKKEWFQGTADAVRQYNWLFGQAVKDGIEDFVILSGDHLYRCNYQDFVRCHRENAADITVAALGCDEKRASAFGLMKIDSTGGIKEFAEKPEGDALKAMACDTSILGLDADSAKERPYIASMGIYVVKAEAMRKLLMESYPDANDFGSEVIPGAVAEGMRVQAYLYDGYWEDIGTIGAFYRASIGLTVAEEPSFSFYDKNAPIYTMSRFLPPSKICEASLERSIVGDGCFVSPGCKITNTNIGLRTIIGPNAVVEDSLVMGCDYYEMPDECELVPYCIPMGIGEGTVVRRAIVDKNVRIGANVKLVNQDGVTEANREDEGVVIKDGIIVVVKDTIVPDGTVI